MSFNNLTSAEAERLALLAEECGEAIQAIGKILRHGYESRHPEGGSTNRELLEFEMGDVHAALDLLYDAGDLGIIEIESAKDRKLMRVGKYMHHQELSNQAVALVKQMTPKEQFLADNLREGETHSGIILDPDGDYHLILMAGEAEEINWDNAVKWVKEHGGELPNRREQSLLFANLKDQFKDSYYWSGERHAFGSDYAWCQGFDNGGQTSTTRNLKLRARIIRRIPL